MKEWCAEDANSIHEVNVVLIEQLLSQETSEINTRLYYEKVQQTFEEGFKAFEDTKQSGQLVKS